VIGMERSPPPAGASGYWLDPIPDRLRADAVRYLDEGAVGRFLACASKMAWVALVAMNRDELARRGVYETALLAALTRPRLNTRHVPLDLLRTLVAGADRARLRQAAGEPLPGPGPFTVYRGVAGRGAERRVRGLNWTGSLDRARWFARRFAHLGDPAVYRVLVHEPDVLAYTNARQEGEFLVLLPATAKPTRVRLRA
jgi:hypothetical protein